MKDEGHWVRVVDWKANEYFEVPPSSPFVPSLPPPSLSSSFSFSPLTPLLSTSPSQESEICDEFLNLDLRDLSACLKACEGCNWVRISFISKMLPSSLSLFPICSIYSLFLLQCFYFPLLLTKVYDLAADMGGMGFIQSNHSVILYNNTMISFNLVEVLFLLFISHPHITHSLPYSICPYL